MNSPNVTVTRLFIFASFPLLALVLTGCRPHEFPQYPPNYREYAYVTNGGSDTVSVFDVVNLRLDREIAVGQNPVAVAASPSRNEVYVVNEGAAAGQTGTPGSVTVINAENNIVAATIPVQRKPVSIEVDSAGNFAYVANSGSNTISILDLKARREIETVDAGQGPVAARISPDGKSLVVADLRGNSATILNPATGPSAGKVRAVFAGCPGASDVVILPDSSKAFLACSAGHQLMAIGLAQTKVIPAQPDRIEALLDVGRGPVQLALKPDGGELFSLNSLADSISEVVTSTDDVGGAYTIGEDPVRGLVSADNALLYVANFRSQYVTIYAINDGKRAGSIHVGDGPLALALSKSGYLLFAVDARSADVAVVRTGSSSLFTLLPTGRAPNAIAIKAFKLP
jgi:YVTN family beta-propeller protein